MKDACLKKVAWYILFVVIISSVVSGFTVHAGKAAIGKAELQTILRQSLKSLWRGESFSPELIQKQKNLRKTLQTGEVKKGELKEMVEQEMASVINHDTTSRYILETMPDRVNALFAP